MPKIQILYLAHHRHTHAQIHKHMHTHVQRHQHTQIQIHRHMHTDTYKYTCRHTCIFVYIHKHTYIYTHAHRIAYGKTKEIVTWNPLLSQSWQKLLQTGNWRKSNLVRLILQHPPSFVMVYVMTYCRCLLCLLILYLVTNCQMSSGPHGPIFTIQIPWLIWLAACKVP